MASSIESSSALSLRFTSFVSVATHAAPSGIGERTSVSVAESATSWKMEEEVQAFFLQNLLLVQGASGFGWYLLSPDRSRRACPSRSTDTAPVEEVTTESAVDVYAGRPPWFTPTRFVRQPLIRESSCHATKSFLSEHIYIMCSVLEWYFFLATDNIAA